MIRAIRRKLLYAFLGSYKRNKQRRARTDIDYCLTVARSMISRSKNAFLVTRAAAGGCSTRLVQPIVDDEFVIWIGTHPGLRKVAEVEANPKVTVAWEDAKHDANLVIYGNARIESDLQLRRSHWKPAWRLFFPDGPASDDYVLIRIDAERMELMNFAKSIVLEPFGLRPVVAVRKDDAWVVG